MKTPIYPLLAPLLPAASPIAMQLDTPTAGAGAAALLALVLCPLARVQLPRLVLNSGSAGMLDGLLHWRL